METRWILVTHRYDGLHKEAVNRISAAVTPLAGYVLPVYMADAVTPELLGNHHLILIGNQDSWTLPGICPADVPAKAEGYSICVGEHFSDKAKQMIRIAGYDDPGTLYGCVEFCNRYCGDVIFRGGNLWQEGYFDRPFTKPLQPWETSCAPAIATRALWTWGHVIFDYKRFFDHMVTLRLNEAVIWNDVAPLNAKDVVDYAHKLGIRVVWGFAWGWKPSCSEILQDYTEETFRQIKQSVLETYDTQYAGTGADGIYFQSFTELNLESLNGRSIPHLVTELVNDIAGTLLERNSGLHIQFGLHATSVKNRLDILRQVDPRIYIVWENCGAFPYSYFTDDVEDFPETMSFTRQLTCLRGDGERFGAVLKGMLKLDWTRFEHFTAPYVMGESTKEFLQERQVWKNKIWKHIQAGWLRNAEYVRQTVAAIAESGGAPIVEALVEDALFENKIMLPVALYAAMLWTPEKETSQLIEEVSNYPSVQFANR